MADVVAPEAGVLKSIAKKYHNLATAISDCKLDIQDARITPGSFQRALDLQALWNERKGDLAKFLDDLSWSIETVAGQLEKIAVKYSDTDHVNDDDARRVGELISVLESKYSGIGSVVPQPSLI